MPKAKPRFTFHLIPNAHLDPVWLWDQREGLNEGLVTCRTVLDLMDEHKELTFIRGETAIYQHIERTDPQAFGRIKKYVKQGRWDPVGGTVIQPDTNLPHPETFARHFLHGQRYLNEKFGRISRVAWAADSFGHAAGLPEILADAGIEFFAFTRPSPAIVPIKEPAFYWAGPSGARVLAYRPPIGWYGCEREEMTKRLDQFLADAPNYSLHNLAVFFGLGNHGGGPTRRHLDEIESWRRAHPEIDVVFSTLHRYFDTLSAEIRRSKLKLPTHQDELNFVLRGCYSSVAKFKFLYRKTEAQLRRATSAVALCGMSDQIGSTNKNHGRVARATRATSQLHDAWEALLFNSFHDILPGSSIERAFDEQIAQLGGADHVAKDAEFHALNALAARIDTTVEAPASKDMPSPVALLVFNPHPFPHTAPIEIEAALDYRPIWKYSTKESPPSNLPLKVLGPDRKEIPFQTIETEHHAMVELAWRKRIVIRPTLPAFGWNIITMAYDESSASADAPREGKSVASAPYPHTISTDAFSITAKPHTQGVAISHDNQPLLNAPGLQVFTYEDPYGSWGGMAEEPESTHLTKIRHHWPITQSRVLESGPLRAALWVRFEGGNSRLDITFQLSPNDPAIRASARLFLNERSARVKLVMPFCEIATYQVPAATVTRPPMGEVPALSCVSMKRDPQNDASPTLGLASNALYNFDTINNTLEATIARASRYADDVVTPPDHEPWRPAVDSGELKFQFLLTPDIDLLPQLAKQLEQPPISLLVPPHKGPLPRAESLASLTPESLDLLALKISEDRKSLIVRVQETQGRFTTPWLTLDDRRVKLKALRPHELATFRLTPARKGYTVTRTNIPEL